MAAPQPSEDAHRDELGQVGVRQVLDVVVLADHEAVARFVAAVDRAVDLEDHGAGVEREPGVLVGAIDQPALAVREAVDEAAVVRATGHVDDDLVGLARVAEGALEDVVVVGGDDELVEVALPLRLQRRGKRREEAVYRVRRVLRVEDVPEPLVQRPLAGGELDVLGDPGQLGPVGKRVAELVGQQPRELGAARRMGLGIPGTVRRPVAEVRPGAEQRHHLAALHGLDHLQAVAVERLPHVPTASAPGRCSSFPPGRTPSSP